MAHETEGSRRLAVYADKIHQVRREIAASANRYPAMSSLKAVSIAAGG